MRRTGQHAVEASFDPLDDRTRDVLTRGAPVSSAAVFDNGDAMPPVSLLLESCSRGRYDGLVRLEMAVNPHKTRQLPRGVTFELLAGDNVLGRGCIHKEVNIFESFRRVTRRQEPFHTQYFSDALTTSLERDRSLFDNVWRLIAPDDWSIPEDAHVEAEKPLKGGRRIDMLVHDRARDRAVGIEVKTVDASAQVKQLGQYWRDLYDLPERPQSIALAYLTPFKDASPEGYEPRTVQAFRSFLKLLALECGWKYAHTHAKHLSWLDVAAIPWDGNELWEQHREYIYKHISSPEARRVSTLKSGRTFVDFFGREPADAFWNVLGNLGISPGTRGVVVELENHDPSRLGATLIEAIEILTESTFVLRDVEMKDRFDGHAQFLDSAYTDLHRSLFGLTRSRMPLWLQGKKNYGLRVAHENHPSGVSLVTSKGPSQIEIGRPR